MKKHYYTLYSLVIIFFLHTNTVYSDTCSSISAGSWDTPGIWDCGHTPGCGDTIYVNHLVQITANVNLDAPGCTTPTFIVITAGGDLNFNSGKKLVLYCGSGVTVQAGAQITSDAGGASENLKICGTTVWQGSWDADLDGPVVLGSGLPVELISFHACFNRNNVDISWATATGHNNDYFTVERSVDGIHFDPIIITDGAGNSSALIEYFEIDYQPLDGISYYRLVQTDYDGISAVSQPVAVRTNVDLAGNLTLFPNPTDGSFHLQISGFGDEEFVVVVRDLTGREHFSKVFVTSTDRHLEAIDPSNKLAAGTYIVTAASCNEFYSQKLVVK